MMLDNVLPASPMDDMIDGRCRDSEISRDQLLLVAGRHPLANPSHERLREFGIRVPLAPSCRLGMRTSTVPVTSDIALSSLLFSVAGVVAGGAKPEMCGVHTRGGVASVKDTEADRDIAKRHPPRNPMGETRAFGIELPVAVGVSTSYPQPTRPQLRHMLRNRSVSVHLVPKTVGDTLVASHAEPPTTKVRWSGSAASHKRAAGPFVF